MELSTTGHILNTGRWSVREKLSIEGDTLPLCDLYSFSSPDRLASLTRSIRNAVLMSFVCMLLTLLPTAVSDSSWIHSGTPSGGSRYIYLDLRICRYRHLRICRYRHLRICRYRHFRICRYRHFRICRYRHLRICRYRHRICRYRHFRICRYRHFRICRYRHFRICRYIHLQQVMILENKRGNWRFLWARKSRTAEHTSCSLHPLPV